MTMSSNYVKVFGAMLLPNIGGLYNGRPVIRANVANWYSKLNFPWFRPPNWVFPVVWTTLYSSMGYASYLVWRDGGGFNGEGKIPLIVYGTQLGLNWVWSPIFFGHKNIKGALIDNVALTVTATVCGILFYGINPIAGRLFIPYLAWLSFATFFNYTLLELNPDKKEIKDN